MTERHRISSITNIPVVGMQISYLQDWTGHWEHQEFSQWPDLLNNPQARAQFSTNGCNCSIKIHTPALTISAPALVSHIAYQNEQQCGGLVVYLQAPKWL